MLGKHQLGFIFFNYVMKELYIQLLACSRTNQKLKRRTSFDIHMMIESKFNHLSFSPERLGMGLKEHCVRCFYSERDDNSL